MEHLIEHGPNDMATVFARAFELAMQIERERFLGAGRYERTPGRQGYANGYKPKRIDTPAGTVSVRVPETADHGGQPFYPQSLERDCMKATPIGPATERPKEGHYWGPTQFLWRLSC